MLDTTCLSGRLGNRFFQNMVVDMFSRRFNLPARYGYFNECYRLGFDLFREGTQTYNETITATDVNINSLLTTELPNANVELGGDVFFQTPIVSQKIRESLDIGKIKQRNFYSSRCNNNSDVFIHVRIGDLLGTNLTPDIEYYEKILNSITFTNGYITSDSPRHPIVEHLVQRYSLQRFIDDEVTTIQFGSTCKYIITAGGTFSWLIALLGFNSEVYYPKDHLTWHGDIYGFSDWKGV